MRTPLPPKGRNTQKSPWSVYAVLALLAIASAVGLDYINWRQSETSYLFSSLAEMRKARKIEKKPILLSTIVLERLASHGISEDAVSLFTDRKGADHLRVILPSEGYVSLVSSLAQDLKAFQAEMRKREEQEDEENIYYLWDVKGRDGKTLSLLFSCPKPAPPPPEKPALEEPKNKVALIMDDMGFSLGAVSELLSLKKPITIAILPYSPLARETAQIAHQNGLEILLHLPMESLNNTEENNGIEGLIQATMNAQEIIDSVEKSIDQVPYVVGVNNHMGSKITPDPVLMEIILERVKLRNLFFVDSRTTGKSVAFDVARRLGIPATQRHVFLDNVPDEESIRKKLIELFTLAQQEGEAVGICHPIPSTLSVLRKDFQLVEAYNLKPVFVSEVVR